MTESRPTQPWREIVTAFLKVGATAYGGPRSWASSRRVIVLVATVAALPVWPVAPVKAILTGAVVGVLRSRVCELPGVGAVLCTAWGR